MFAVAIDDDLALRLYERRDAEALYDLVEANRDLLERWFPWTEGTRGPDDTRAFIEDGLRRFAAGNGFECGIVEKGRLVGTLGLHFVTRPEGVTEMGYWLDEDAQGRGLVTRSVAGLLPHLFGTMDLNRVEIRADPANDRSRAVPERLGFRQEGVLRQVGLRSGHRYDHAVYALLRDEWRAGRDATAET
ncbi:MAG: GNAT family protein [Trueperaceae bacterium]|nr:GNAT family protein [Trueperaceae bacterium]